MNFDKESGEDDAQMDMTPMIDVVFLLIIFFMLVTQFSNQVLAAGIELPIAEKSIEDDPGQRMVINIDEKGNYILRGVQKPKEVIEAKLMAYGERKKERYKGMMISDMKVMIRADKYTPYKYIQKVYFMLQKATIWKVCFATVKERK